MFDESAVDLTALKYHLPELEALWQELDDSRLKYKAAVDAVAEKTGVDKKVLSKLVNAIKKDKAEKEASEAQELATLVELLTSVTDV